MDLYFSEKGRLKMSMVKYNKNIIKYFEKHMGHIEETPASDHSFQVQNDTDKNIPPESQAYILYS